MNAIDFARNLKLTNPKKFYDLMADGYGLYWMKKEAPNEELALILEYINVVEDEANEKYKINQMEMRNYESRLFRF